MRPADLPHSAAKTVALLLPVPVAPVGDTITSAAVDVSSDVDIDCAGSAYNQAGRSSGLTAPNGPAQTALVKTALAYARLTPHDIASVSLHGTGTPLGAPHLSVKVARRHDLM